MGKTYRGLSKKEREKLKNSRKSRHKRELNDQPAADNWKKNRNRTSNMDRNVSFNGRDYGYEE